MNKLNETSATSPNHNSSLRRIRSADGAGVHPLATRFQRAHRWFIQHGIEAPNMASLKLMFDAESRGWG